MDTLVEKVSLDGYCGKNNTEQLQIYINLITIDFADGKRTTLSAYTEMPELLTVFCDINRKYSKDSELFNIHKTLRDKMIRRITMNDTPTFSDTLDGFHTFYNKITIEYDADLTYEFYILRSSNGVIGGYFLMG